MSKKSMYIDLDISRHKINSEKKWISLDLNSFEYKIKWRKKYGFNLIANRSKQVV